MQSVYVTTLFKIAIHLIGKAQNEKSTYTVASLSECNECCSALAAASQNYQAEGIVEELGHKYLEVERTVHKRTADYADWSS